MKQRFIVKGEPVPKSRSSSKKNGKAPNKRAREHQERIAEVIKKQKIVLSSEYFYSLRVKFYCSTRKDMDNMLKTLYDGMSWSANSFDDAQIIKLECWVIIVDDKEDSKTIVNIKELGRINE